MKMIVFTNSDRVPTIGTSRIGTIETTYDTLVKAFGEPTDTGASTLGKGDPPYYADTMWGGDKVTAEWVLAFAVGGGDPEDGGMDDSDCVIATVYDYKTGCTPMEKYNWHVGGFDQNALRFVEMRLAEAEIA
tara:strand:- start:1323 stop:1718 length:396 start_codon:yes stop_codon:yes gene_type:complete